MVFKHMLTTSLLLGLAPVAWAQSGPPAEPHILYACYIPQSGVVYRVGAPGLRSETPQCISSQHVLFGWNEKGIKGDKGDKGEKGDPGQPGSVAFAGQMCPERQSLVGFSAVGTLVCAEGGAPSPPPPPPPPTNAFEGTWTFAPTLTTTCPAQPVSLVLALNGATTRLSEPGVLTVVLIGAVTSPMVVPFSAETVFPLDETAGTFGGSTSFSHDVTGSVSYTASGTATIAGTFTGLNSLTASIAFTLTIEVHADPVFGSQTITCAPINGTVTGTRAGS